MSDQFVVENKRQSHKENLHLDQYQGADWGERLSFTVGVSYMSGGALGILRGCVVGRPKNFRLPKKLLLNNFFNAVAKDMSRFGQGCAAASFLYYLVGSSLNLFFEDELAEISNTNKNVICGAITGSIYKSTLGIVPSCVGFVLGGATIGGLTHLVNYLNRRGTVAFEMRF